MRNLTASVALLFLLLAPPAPAAKLVDAPPPPPMPEGQLETDGSVTKPLQPGLPSRGQMLYENHCMTCHESVAFIRTNQQVRTHAALRETVARWAANTSLPWGKEEVEEVTRYLDNTYYRFPP